MKKQCQVSRHKELIFGEHLTREEILKVNIRAHRFCEILFQISSCNLEGKRKKVVTELTLKNSIFVSCLAETF